MGTDAIAVYLEQINRAVAKGNATEHTHRPALKGLIESLGKNITATNEPKRVACGAPDFVVSRRIRRAEHAFGYIECKDVGVNLKKEEKSEQLKRYRGSLDNLVLTDYINFRLYVGGELQETGVLAKEGKGGAYVVGVDGVDQLKKVLAMFFAAEPIRISSAKVLAEKMAGMAQLLREMIKETFAKEAETGALHGQYEAFRKVLLHDLEPDAFADMYAQTICYGMFAATCHMSDEAIWGKDKYAAFHGVDGKHRELTRETAAYLLPKTNPFLRNIFGDIAGPGMDDRIAWLVDDLVVLLQNTQMDKVLKGFGRNTNRKDPVIHFYETFLAAYDPKMREARGVYYTPEPVVSYIVRSVDWLLKEKFGLKKGLADNSKVKIEYKRPAKKGAKVEVAETKELHKCLILDPAAGTGTFLYEVVREIHKRFARNKGAWPGYVKDHLLPRLFGFELMMAPYAICHMKLGLELADLGYDFEADERLGVYLTNTLEEVEEMSGLPLFTQWLAEEARAANEVKRDLPIMVVLGNPPYSGHSANASERITELKAGQKYDVVTKKGMVTRTAPKGGKNIKERTFIGRLIQDYYYVDGEALGEKNPKWLQDDYVKFIRYGQHRIAQTGAGILAFITNHGYLDNPTFRGMRQQLMETFSEIYILDLHGNAKKKEVCPDGSEDKNVFDILQGVSIGIFVKTPEADGDGAVFHTELWGTRKQKYQWLFENEITSTQWHTVEPETPFYLFKPQDKERVAEYGKFLKVTDLMQTNVLGFQTHRDHFAVAIDEKQLRGRFEEMRNEGISDYEFAERYSLRENPGWKLAEARTEIRGLEDWDSPIMRCAYRPFDDRWCYFSGIVMDRPRRELMDHVAGKGNICLGLGRQGLAVNDPVWSLIQVCRNPIDANIFRRGGINVFPLYLYPQDETEKGRQRTFGGGHGNWERGEDGRVPNLDKVFVDAFAERVGLGFVSDGRGDLKETFGPEDLFDYIYGVFHCPTYRSRYAEFLKIDFPRLPLPRDCELFRSVARLGGELVGLHLMESDVLDAEGRGPEFGVEGDMEVAKGYPKYDVGEGRVYINEKQYFAGVGEAVWDFHIGGYQVCGKWLKDRRGRVLSYDDVEHYRKVVVALGETIRIMGEIDEVIDGLGGWPIDE